MTDFTLSSGNVCLPYRSPWGAFPTRMLGISTGISSQGIARGRVVTIDAVDVAPSTFSGYVKASTGDNAFYIAGISAETVPSTAVVGTGIMVYEANPNVEFKAVTKGNVLSNSMVGRTATLHRDSTLDIAYVDLTGSTASDHRVIVTGLIDQQGDSGGYVTFRFLTALAGNVQGSSGFYNSTTPILAFYR